MPIITTTDLTPDKAKVWLADHNAMNRPLRDTWVGFLAQEMTDGHWVDNGDTFCFDDQGVLVDGQHRCAAVIRSGVTIPAHVVRKLDPRSRLTIDANLRRKFSDDLAMNGQKNGPKIEALMRKIVRWNRDHGFANHDQLSRTTLSEAYPECAEQVATALAAADYYRKVPVSTGILAFMWWLATNNAPEEYVRRFFSILAIGSQEKDDRILITLREKFLNDYLVRGRRQGTNETIYYMIRAWNAWATGEKFGKFILPRGGLKNPYPQLIPVELTK